MPSQFSAEVDVWNLILDHLAETPLSTTSDDRPEARWLERNFDHVRDGFTRLRLWNWAMQQNELTVDGTAPTYRWSYRYQLPSGWLRVKPPVHLGEWGGRPIPHQVMGNYLLCDTPADDLRVETVMRVTDFTAWDPLALDAFSFLAALKMSYRFTNKATFADRLSSYYSEALTAAELVDAGEGTPEPVEQHSVIDARG